MHFLRRCYVLSLAVFAACLACRQAASEEPATPAAVKSAIRERAKGYLKAIKTGDSEEIASFWTEQGDYVDDKDKSSMAAGLQGRPRPARNEKQKREN